MAGVVAGQDAECLGFAPDTEIYAYRVFTDAQVMHTLQFFGVSTVEPVCSRARWQLFVNELG